MPHPQDSTDTPQTQDRGEPVSSASQKPAGSTRLPQPRVLPLRSESEAHAQTPVTQQGGEALGTASDQAVTPSPRPPGSSRTKTPVNFLSSAPPFQTATQPQPPSGPRPPASPGRESPGGETPLISPPVQEPLAAPQPTREGRPLIKLPRISTPFSEQLPQNMDPSDSRSAKERQTPKAAHSSSKKISDMHVPHPKTTSQDSPQELGKKNFLATETQLKRPTPEKDATWRSPHSIAARIQRKPTHLKAPSHPNPSPSRSPPRESERKSPNTRHS